MIPNVYLYLYLYIHSHMTVCSSQSASANTIFNPIMIQNIVTLPNFMLLMWYHSLWNMDSYTILNWLIMWE